MTLFRVALSTRQQLVMTQPGVTLQLHPHAWYDKPHPSIHKSKLLGKEK